MMIVILFAAGRSSMAQTAKPARPKAGLAAIQKKYGLDPKSSLVSRLTTTPAYVMDIFRNAGMSPTEHQVTKDESRILSEAIAVLPPLHQRVLKQHLKSISFVDNMPNTAITAPVTKEKETKLFHIAFRAGILHQTISEWVTEKERNCYTKGDSAMSVSIQAGLMSALTYVLLHEGTHVVDGALGLLNTDTIAGRPVPNPFRAGFSKNIWSDIGTHIWPFPDSLAAKSIFRPGGRRFALSEAEQVYKALSQTPFVSLYGSASWHEDLAELLTIYHLTKMHGQPFQAIVKKNGNEVFRFEPISSPAVERRFVQLDRFYRKAG
ncbi:hypothetical protein [Mucilaginibacter pedocola]|nr:hypothetical protein [Mucilaginibacter pedocola]